MKRLKAEWEEQSAVLMAYPHTATDWGAYLNEAQDCFYNIIRALSHYQEMIVCVHPNDTKSQDSLAKLSQVHIALVDSNDTWTRDFGPLCVETNGIALYLDFIFNAWGGKYQANLDNTITSKLMQKGLLKHSLRSVNFVLEGGSVESDGAGSILTTTSCLLNPERNPNLDQAQIAGVLKRELGAQQILWLEVQPLAGDDTDGHIDTLARFLDPNTIAYVYCENRSDPHYNNLKNMDKQLRRFRNVDGKRYKLLPLPLPSPKFYQGVRLPATYANFLWVNNNGQRVLFVPTYQDPADDKVLKLLRSYIETEVVGVDCSVLIRQKGSLHCATMQLY
ncbi:Agmatine deiminase [Helicobacter sp. NHP19-012]|uniref:Agmatine deiminase n=1 Tax=Helicobacter gastrofelis TaxID=2849642 RepID=A0ABM7SFE8_9HELI|nr:MULTISPECIES: agmatine deiminase family protein [unclassified Helicobacter]BCZ18682.1 Agmatine deiminase [Helicobacter sp. NHP19-012]GMB95949.1 Agmatine deiminase [Helicobacter sp. NHP22-001]